MTADLGLSLLRNSERSSFKECMAQWNWAWNLGLIPAMPKNDARWFGSGVHLGLAEWYMPKGAKNGLARGPHPAETFEKYAKGAWTTVSASPFFDAEGEKEYIDARKLGVDVLTGYVEHYGGNDPTVEVVFPEYRYATKIPWNKRQIQSNISHYIDPEGDSAFIAMIVGTFDMVFRDLADGFMKLMDHKTAASKESGAHLTKDDQAGTYIAVSTHYLRKQGILKGNESVVGMTYNYLRKARRDPDMLLDEQGRKRNQPQKKHYAEALATRGVGVAAELAKLTIPQLQALAKKLEMTIYGDVSKVQPAPLFWREDVRRSTKNRLRQIERIADDAEMISRARMGDLPITKNPGKHCAWCDYRDLCDIDEDGEDVEGFIKAVFVQRDMYADHRDGAENSKVSVENTVEAKSNVRRVDFG